MPKFASCTPSTLTGAEFVASFGAVFEHAPWVAKRAFAAGITPACDEIDELHALFATVVAAADDNEKDELIANHPALAAAVPAGASHANSRGEQARAGLAALDASGRARFAKLNRQYREKFGFVFILAVEGLDAATILATFERRLATGTAASERAEALAQIVRIARLRMGRL